MAIPVVAMLRIWRHGPVSEKTPSMALTPCCDTRPLHQHRRKLYVCPGCERHYSTATGEQVESWAWEWVEDRGMFQRKASKLQTREIEDMRDQL